MCQKIRKPPSRAVVHGARKPLWLRSHLSQGPHRSHPLERAVARPARPLLRLKKEPL